MRKEEFIKLLDSYRSDRCTPEEAEQLLHHIQSGRDKEQVEKWIAEGFGNLYDYDFAGIPEIRSSLDKVFQQIQENKEVFSENQSLKSEAATEPIAQERAGQSSRIRRLYQVSTIAAVILCALTFGIYFYNNQAPATTEYDVVNLNKVTPGGNRATITLGDGRTIDLSEDQNGVIIDADKIKYNDGTFVIPSDSDGSLSTTQSDTPERQLALTTPKGGTYQVTLPDGTKVWLNAASTLKYPSRFTEEERIVELEGEAYFDVHEAYQGDGRKKIPFKVKSNQQEIEVLGTQFNVSSYKEQAYTKTTLIKGKVLVRNKKSRLTLSPGEQATTKGSQIQIHDVDVTNYTAWRYGKFSFDGKSFEEVMDEIGRWYDLTIVYENEIPDDELVGDAFRNQNFGLVLRLLEAIAIDYELDVANRKLIIKGKKNRIENLKPKMTME